MRNPDAGPQNSPVTIAELANCVIAKHGFNATHAQIEAATDSHPGNVADDVRDHLATRRR